MTRSDEIQRRVEIFREALDTAQQLLRENAAKHQVWSPPSAAPDNTADSYTMADKGSGEPPGPAKESDPSGRDAHSPGAKLDSGKVRADLVLDGFGLALLEVAKVATHGAQKYTDNGWQSVPDGGRRYRSAGVSRHSGVYPLSKAPAGENDL